SRRSVPGPPTRWPPTCGPPALSSARTREWSTGTADSLKARLGCSGVSTCALRSPESEVLAMKAALCTRYGPPEVLQLRDVPKPVPRKRDVLIRIHAAAVTVSDVYIRSGVPTAQLWFRVLSRLAVGLRRPRRSIIGMVMAGEIEAIGSGVTRFRVGDRVYGSTIMRMGCYAEYTRIPAKGGVLAPAPRNLTHAEAAAIDR